MIRKTVLLISGTVAGVVGVVSYNPPQLNATIDASSNSLPTSPQSTPEASPSESISSVRKNKTNTTNKTINSKVSPEATPSASEIATNKNDVPVQDNSAGTSGVFQGEPSVTRWGPVQVEITVVNGKITEVSTLQYPRGDRRSLSISNQVLPWLQQETLRTQSTNITGVSGATYTSTGFRNSLASALQKAGL